MLKKIMMFIVATDVVASRQPEHQATGTLVTDFTRRNPPPPTMTTYQELNIINFSVLGFWDNVCQLITITLTSVQVNFQFIRGPQGH